MAPSRNTDPAFINDHNQEAQAVWDAFCDGNPIRPPVMLGTATQFFIFNDALNPGEVVTFEKYCTDAAIMLDYLTEVTEGTIARIRAHLDFFGLPNPDTTMFFADDSIQLISTEMLSKFILPVYRKLKAGITTAENIKVHLCGDASRHFKTLKDELGCNDFETGFPIDFGKIRKQLGPEVTIHGGPNIMLLRHATPREVTTETRRILESGVLEGGKFVLREANNLAPNTPFENLNAMYQTARSLAL